MWSFCGTIGFIELTYFNLLFKGGYKNEEIYDDAHASWNELICDAYRLWFKR